MEKKEITVCVLEENYFEDELMITDFNAIIKKASDKGATHIQIESEYESYYAKVKFVFKRLETDEEFESRMKDEETSKKRQDTSDRQLYEQLKKRFGK